MKNTVASIQGRLRVISRSNGQNHQLILTRYFQERLLYRLAQSAYRSDFLLKGGTLLYAWEGLTTRPTLDVDLLGWQISNDLNSIKVIFQEICGIDYPKDCVIYNFSKLEVSEIVKEGNYTGVRIKVPVNLGQISQRLHIDIGFGDAVTPGPVEMVYPTLLPMDEPEILAYSKENLIAEKFEAMIALGELNSRMKDFYDLYSILTSDNSIDLGQLEAAILATFNRRRTRLTKDHPLFDPAFAKDKRRVTQWRGYLKKIKLDPGISLHQVMIIIQEKLESIYVSMLKNKNN
jgi:hypothetical protein